MLALARGHAMTALGTTGDDDRAGALGAVGHEIELLVGPAFYGALLGAPRGSSDVSGVADLSLSAACGVS
jgi:hypothetical protein